MTLHIFVSIQSFQIYSVTKLLTLILVFFLIWCTAHLTTNFTSLAITSTWNMWPVMTSRNQSEMKTKSQKYFNLRNCNKMTILITYLRLSLNKWCRLAFYVDIFSLAYNSKFDFVLYIDLSFSLIPSNNDLKNKSIWC